VAKNEEQGQALGQAGSLEANGDWKRRRTVIFTAFSSFPQKSLE
jgi:hypothetical protein